MNVLSSKLFEVGVGTLGKYPKLLLSFYAGLALSASAFVLLRRAFNHAFGKEKKIKEFNMIDVKDDKQYIIKNVKDDKKYIIKTLKQLRSAIPVGPSGSCLTDAPKVLDYLDDQMISFIRQSNFVHIATCSISGKCIDNAPASSFVSPIGNTPGFVQIMNTKAIQIPDFPDNSLIFGLQSILENPMVGICFQIPGTSVTLRMGGCAELNCDPEILSDFASRGIDATIVIAIKVQYAFFLHSKAYIRSQIWKPQTWPEEPYKVRFGRYFSNDPLVQSKINNNMEKHHMAIQESTDDNAPEPN